VGEKTVTRTRKEGSGRGGMGMCRKVGRCDRGMQADVTDQSKNRQQKQNASRQFPLPTQKAQKRTMIPGRARSCLKRVAGTGLKGPSSSLGEDDGDEDPYVDGVGAGAGSLSLPLGTASLCAPPFTFVSLVASISACVCAVDFNTVPPYMHVVASIKYEMSRAEH
jgi:hypothetical protein